MGCVVQLTKGPGTIMAGWLNDYWQPGVLGDAEIACAIAEGIEEAEADVLAENGDFQGRQAGHTCLFPMGA